MDTNIKTVAGPIQVMLMEHDSAGNLLKEITKLTQAFEAPDDGCQSFQLLYKELKFLETHRHLLPHKRE